jgi:DNA-nicking Smr family endonuclease
MKKQGMEPKIPDPVKSRNLQDTKLAMSIAETAGCDHKIDLHRMSVGEARVALELFFRDEYDGTQKVIEIVHGHGTGVLKKLVAEFVRTQIRAGKVIDSRIGLNGARIFLVLKAKE